MGEPIKWVTINGRHVPIYEDNGTVTPPSDKAFDSWKEAEDWLVSNLGYNSEEARRLTYATEAWSNYNSKEIHEEKSDNYAYPIENVRRDIEALDTYINNPKVAKTKGTLYRGVVAKTNSWTNEDVRQLENKLDSGIWTEPGITAFSKDKDIAYNYTGLNISKMGIGIVVEMKNNKHAVDIGHLSVGGGEQESLYPSSIKKNGLKIVSWKKEPTAVWQQGKRQGQPLGWLYKVIVEDR